MRQGFCINLSSFASKDSFCSYSFSLAVGSTDKIPNAASQFQRKRLTASEEISVCFCSHFE